MKNGHHRMLGLGIAAVALIAGPALAQTHFHTGGRVGGPEQEPDGFVPVWQQQQQSAQQKAKQEAAEKAAKENSGDAQKDGASKKAKQ
jgi:hypothetical protein